MRILLTGGSGSVGQSVVNSLVEKGHVVRVIGRREGIQMPGAEYQPCDINDYPNLREVTRGCEAIVHLAALAAPMKGSPQEIFRVNCLGTFNVFQAAEEEGIRRIVQASSINASGQFYGVKPAPLDYLPLDEDHPFYSTDAYSFSKTVIEDIGEYFWRRDGITSLAYRLPWVAPADVHNTLAQRRERISTLVENLLKRTRAEQLSWFDQAWSAYNEFRAERPYEKEGYVMPFINNQPEEKRSALSSMSQRVNFFTMLDERDSAQAVVKGLEADLEGCYTLSINDANNWTGIETRILVDLFYPDVKEFRKELTGFESLVSIDRARKLIGFEPQYDHAL